MVSIQPLYAQGLCTSKYTLHLYPSHLLSSHYFSSSLPFVTQIWGDIAGTLQRLPIGEKSCTHLPQPLFCAACLCGQQAGGFVPVRGEIAAVSSPFSVWREVMIFSSRREKIYGLPRTGISLSTAIARMTQQPLSSWGYVWYCCG